MLARKIALNTIISAAARILGTALALVTIGLITRYLTKNEWGEYSIVLTFGGIFAVLAEGGLYQLMVREISKNGADEKEVASNIFTVRLLLGLFIFALAPLISFLFPYSAQARWGILVGMIGFWFFSGSQVTMGIFQKYLRMDKVALAELAGRASQLVLVFLFIRWQLNFLWIVASLTFGGLINFLLIYWLAQSHIAMHLRWAWNFWKKIIKQNYPLALAGILTMIYFSSDSLIISVFKPAADVGIYRLSYKILESLIFFPAMFVGLVMPILSRTAFSDWLQFKKVLQRSQEVLLIFALPLVLGILAVSPKIIRLLGGQNYPESVGVLNILIVAVGIIFFGTLFSYALIALEKQKTLLWISAAGAVFNVVLNLIFIPRYSYLAAAVITVLTELLVTVLMIIVVSQTVRFSFSFRTGFKSLAAALVMAAVLWWLRDLNLLVLLAAAGAVYFGALCLLRGFSVRELLALVRQQA
ncbi:MAG: Heteropolysaccharide repeat-containing protein [Parcubacteria group bacterium LiPW_39]|nr:MAG: Heteropolysaccharide repeat-containing protein [Parcubacteria group bacterium LiPW_39]